MAISKEKSQSLELPANEPLDKVSGQRRGIIAFVDRNRRPLSALLVFIVMMLVFIILNPKVFLNPLLYKAALTPLPVSILVAVPLVFVIAAGETDLSFGSTMALGAWAFAAAVDAGWNPFLSLILGLVVGAGAGFLNGIIVTRIGLSSLVSTLGMSYLLRGLINVGTQGLGIPLTYLKGTSFYNTFVGSVGGFPVQMIWALGFAVIGTLLFNYHKFGARICCVGDNLESAREMGIDVRRVKTLAFVYVGLAAGMAGILSTLILTTFWPTTGEGYMLTVLAATFVGGTPSWGGVGTVPGAVIGTLIVGFIETGIVAAGVSHLFRQFFYGLIMVLALIGHKFNEPRYRY